MENISLLRYAFIKAREDMQKAETFFNLLKKITAKTPLFDTYRTAGIALQAKYALTPWAKYMFLLQVQTEFKTSISKAPHNIEMRFIRFSVEHHTPAFLGMSQHLEEDKKIMIENFWNEENDEELREILRKFLTESGRCSAEELQKMRNLKQ